MKSNFESLDTLQRTLADQVFHYASDRKKAAGRALGTLVELVTYCTLRSWGLSDHIVIERRVPEFANPEIVHNVEFSLHALRTKRQVSLSPVSFPVTASKVLRNLPDLSGRSPKSVRILGKELVKKNAAILVDDRHGLVVANVESLDGSRCSLAVCEVVADPFAIVECKRVGVEEGLRKGPQTIEKAKQGSYVARSVSSLQKIRQRNGEFHGFFEQADGQFRSGPYKRLRREAIKSSSVSEFPGFVLTIGIVSNHGNWFTSDSQNKELRILAQSYDWLLFLTDRGLARFIDDLLLKPSGGSGLVRKAFLESYSGQRSGNRFTKVRIDADADGILKSYFSRHRPEIEGWFNVISPLGGGLGSLRSDLLALANRGSLSV